MSDAQDAALYQAVGALQGTVTGMGREIGQLRDAQNERHVTVNRRFDEIEAHLDTMSKSIADLAAAINADKAAKAARANVIATIGATGGTVGGVIASNWTALINFFSRGH